MGQSSSSNPSNACLHQKVSESQTMKASYQRSKSLQEDNLQQRHQILGQKNRDEEIRKLKAALESNPKNVIPYLLLIRRHVQVSNLSDMLGCIQQIFQLTKEDSEIKRILGNPITNSHIIFRIKDEVQKSNKYRYIQDHLVLTLMESDLVCQNLNFNDLELEQLYKCINQAVRAALRRCNELWPLRDQYAQVIEMGMPDEDLYLLYGQILKAQYSYDKEQQCYLKGIKFNPTSSELHLRLGNIYKNQLKINNALMYYKKELDLASQKVDQQNLYLKLGNLYFEEKHFKPAIRLFLNYMSLDCSNPQVIYKLIISYINQNNAVEAVKYIDTFRDSNPSEIEYYLGLRHHFFTNKKQIHRFVYQRFEQTFGEVKQSLKKDINLLFRLSLLLNVSNLSKLTDGYLIEMHKILCEQMNGEQRQTSFLKFLQDCIDYCSYFELYESFGRKRQQLQQIKKNFLTRGGQEIDVSILFNIRDMLTYPSIFLKKNKSYEQGRQFHEHLDSTQTQYDNKQSLIFCQELRYSGRNELPPLSQSKKRQSVQTADTGLRERDSNASNISSISSSIKIFDHKPQSLETEERKRMKELRNSQQLTESSPTFSVVRTYDNKFQFYQILIKEGHQRYIQLLFRNHCYMIRYLDDKRQSNKSFKYIALHYLDERKVIKDQYTSDYKQFELKVESGHPAFLPSKEEIWTQKNYVERLWGWGKEEVANWLICFIRGILQLQEYGLFHADLQMRNTIMTKNISKQDSSPLFMYKIIDFDYAFKLRSFQNEHHICLLNHTKQLIRFYLQREQISDYHNFIVFFFRNIDKNDQKRKTIIEQLIKDFRSKAQLSKSQDLQHLIDQIMKNLWEYSLLYHRKQLIDRINELFINKENLKISTSADIKTKLLEKAKKINVKNEKQNLNQYHQLIQIIKEEFSK